MTMAKFIAVLAMIAAYAAVDVAVPVKATDFTQESMFETADTPSALPGADDIVRPLPTNSTVEVAEERGYYVELNLKIFDHLLSSIKKLTNEPHIPASGAAAFDLNAKPLSGGMERTGKRAKVEKPFEDIDKLDDRLAPSGKTLDVNAVPHLSSEAELKPRAKDLQSAESSLTKSRTKRKSSDDLPSREELEAKMAFNIPLQPPYLQTIEGQEALVHKMHGKHLSQLSIPAKKWKIGNNYLQYQRDLLLRQEAPELEKWLKDDVLSKTADAIRFTHRAGFRLSVDDLNKFTYALALNVRDAYIRQLFPRWYSSLLRQAQVESALKSTYHLSGIALEYYMTQYSIFCEFAEALLNTRRIKHSLPPLNVEMKLFGSDFGLTNSVLMRTRDETGVNFSEKDVKTLTLFLMDRQKRLSS